MKCFISYSHHDRKHKKKFRQHLKPLEEKYGLKIFDDKAILAGEDWEIKIWEEFDKSQIIFILVSIDFIGSNFCFQQEFKRAVKKHKINEAIVIPIILKECAWKEISELASMQALPDEGKPISGGGFKSIDAAMLNVIKGIEKKILAIDAKKSKSTFIKRRPSKPLMEKYKDTPYRAVFFDLDGTLVKGKIGHEYFRYSWQLVWSHLGFDDSVRKSYYQKYIDNEISYHEWCNITRDIFREKGLHESNFREMAKKVRLTKNCKETIRILRHHNVMTVIVSGGIDTFLGAVFPDYREYFDYVFINKFQYDAKGIIENIATTTYDFSNKFDAIEFIRQKYDLSYKECVFVGEGRNDIYAARELAKHGGLSIGYPSEHLQDYATFDLWKDRLDAILDLMFNNPQVPQKLPFAKVCD